LTVEWPESFYHLLTCLLVLTSCAVAICLGSSTFLIEDYGIFESVSNQTVIGFIKGAFLPSAVVFVIRVLLWLYSYKPHTFLWFSPFLSTSFSLLL